MYTKLNILILILILIVILGNLNLIIFIFLLILFVLILKYFLLETKNKYNKTIKNTYCRKSDINNPMGNVLLYTQEDKLEYNICSNENIDSNLRFNIYNNSKDLFLRKNNIRPFITMPSIHHPNNIDNFKNNLYNFNDESCKLTGTNCMFNENIKYHKNYFIKK